MNKEKIRRAIVALQSNDRAEIVAACGALDDGERECVQIILEFLDGPVKRKRSDAGKPRAKKESA